MLTSGAFGLPRRRELGVWKRELLGLHRRMITSQKRSGTDLVNMVGERGNATELA